MQRSDQRSLDLDIVQQSLNPDLEARFAREHHAQLLKVEVFDLAQLFLGN